MLAKSSERIVSARIRPVLILDITRMGVTSERDLWNDNKESKKLKETDTTTEVSEQLKRYAGMTEG